MSEPKKYKHLPEKFPTREEVKGIDVDKLVNMLLSAFADEILAWYQYYVSGYAVKGHTSTEIEDVFKKIADDELNDHAKLLADRLQNFDVDPPDFRDLWHLSKCRQTELPEDPHDIDGFIIASILAERCALAHYREIFNYVFGKDPITEEIIEDIMKDEAEHETIFRSLLSKEGLKRLEELEKK
ncbi:MAG: ferritin [Crenarchaeota archaeon]|nr:ferritin [Thermoproteota archaeon]MCR8455648.1 ferritin [Thermoproteota archaeon]MCR8471795.1 ferritin [Thermoproteota archaeon]MCR8488600.1 ferritin [Thermoproteota archaeon]MCR8501352.1 ferritin [Thermoproteota archaeon]